MLKLDSTKKLYTLWTTLTGLISYVIAGFVVNLLNYTDEMVLPLLCLLGAVAGLFFGFLLSKGKKMITIAISSAVGLTASLIVGFALGYILPSYASFLGQVGYEIVSSIIILIIFGTVMAPSLNGLRAMPFYILTCGILGIIFGASSIFTLFGEGYIPAIIAPFGMAIGLSTGLYTKRQSHKK